MNFVLYFQWWRPLANNYTIVHEKVKLREKPVFPSAINIHSARPLSLVKKNWFNILQQQKQRNEFVHSAQKRILIPAREYYVAFEKSQYHHTIRSANWIEKKLPILQKNTAVKEKVQQLRFFNNPEKIALSLSQQEIHLCWY